MSGKESQRVIALDVIRTIAIISVVLNHAVEIVYPIHEDQLASFAMHGQIFANLCWCFGRSFGVPLFFFLTGYLLLARDYEEKGRIDSFYKHNYLPLLLVWEVWIVICYIFISMCDNVPFSVFSIVRQCLFLEHVEMPQTWYMPVILGIYLVIPFISIALKRIDAKVLVILLLISYLYFFIVPSLNAMINNEDYILVKQIDLSFFGGSYGFYIIVGYCFNKYEKLISNCFNRKKRLLIPATICVASYLLTVYIQIVFRHHGSTYILWYHFFLIPISAICMFVILKSINTSVYFDKFFTTISKCSFGIYLVHYMILRLLYKCFCVVGLTSHCLLTILGFCAAFLISLLLVKLLSLNRYLKWIVLYK